MKRAWGFVLLCLVGIGVVGCAGPSAWEKSQSQCGVTVRKPFNEKNFHDGGGTDDKDGYGNQILWELTTSYWSGYTLEVRSCGPDGLPYTSDDIVVHRTIAVSKNPEDEGWSERLVRGLARGTIKGVRQGITAPVNTAPVDTAPRPRKDWRDW
jgi:hypothetical protein